MSILDENFAYALVSSSDRTLKITGVNTAKYHAGNANWGSFPTIPELYAGGTPAYNGYGAPENAFVVVEITSGAFNGRTEFAEGPLVLPKTLLRIGDNAFKSVKITGRLTIPASVTQIGANAFDNTLIDELLVENAALTDLLSGVVDATRVTSKETEARVATDTALTGLKVTKAEPVFTGTTTIATAAVSEMEVSSHATVQTASIATGSVTNTATVDYYEPNVSEKKRNARFRVFTTAGNLLSVGGVSENIAPIEIVLSEGTYRTGAALTGALVTALNAKNIAWVGGPPMQTISWINTSFDATTGKVRLGYSTDAPGSSEPSIVIRTKFSRNGISYDSSSLLGAVSANIGGSDEPGAFIVTYGNRFGLSFPQAINLGTPMLNVNGDANLAGSGTVNGEWNFIGNKPRYNAEVLATESFTLSKIQVLNGTSLLSTVRTLADVASAIGADPQFAVNVQASQSSILKSVMSLASVRSTEVSLLSSALSSQVSALQSTDASLSSAISGAVPVRVSQVESVSAVLQTAVSQMQSADVSISTALSTATSQRITQTMSLNSAISTTASLLQNADTALSTGLSTATLTRSVNISTKSSMWSAHVSVLQTVDASLSTAVVGAASVRSSAVSSLSSLVSTTVPVLESGHTTFQTALSEHTTNRVASIVSLTDEISTQISTAQSLNALLLPQITAAASTAPAATTSTVFNLVNINVNDSVKFQKTNGVVAIEDRITITYSPTDYLKGTVTAVSGSEITFKVTQKATTATETTIYTTSGPHTLSSNSATEFTLPITNPGFTANSNFVITSITTSMFTESGVGTYQVQLLDKNNASLVPLSPLMQLNNDTQTANFRTHGFTTAFVPNGATNLKIYAKSGGGPARMVINATDSGAFTTMKGYAVNYSSGSVFIESNGALQSTRISAVGALSTSALGQVGALSTVISANQSGIALQTSERTASISSIMSATAQSVTSLQAATSAHGSAVGVAVSERNSGVSSLTSSINASVLSLSSLATSISGAVSTQVANRSSQVLTAVTSLVGAAPASLDTLFEIAATLDAGPTLYSTLSSTETSRETLMATSDTATNLTVSGAGTEYVINGSSKPVLTLIRGNRYTFNIGAGGHPFYFQTSGLSYNASLVYSPTGPKVRGIATQYVAVGTGVGIAGNVFHAQNYWTIPPGYIGKADYRLRFSNGVISDLTIHANPFYTTHNSLINPDISFALSDIPAIGVTAILQGRDRDFPANGWFDVNVPTKDITPGTTTIKFSGSSGTSYFLTTPVMSTATIVFDVPNDAPNTLTYVSQDKPNMGNTVNVFNNTRIKEVVSVSISLSAAASTLQLADASLSAGISSAVSVRTSQAASVSSGVSTVISSAISTQSATSAGISSTVSLRASGVASISTALAALSSAAQLSDLSAGSSITAAISARQSGTASTSTVLSTAVSGFESVGATLSSAVSTAVSVRQSDTASVSTALSTAVSGQHQTLVSLASVQSALSAGINVSALANLSDVNSAIEAVVGVGAVTTLDTLNELATAISNDATVGTTLIGLLNNRATQSEVEALGSEVLLKASQADLTQLVSTVGTKVGDASVTQLESAVTSMTVVTTSVSSQVQILQTNMAASSQTIGLLSDIIRQIDTLYEYIGSVDASGNIIYAVNKLADMVLVSSSLVFTINPTTYAVSKVAQLAVVRFDPTQTSFTYSNRGIGPIPVSLPSGTHTHTFSIDSSDTTDYTNNATDIVITADPTALRAAPANSPFTVPKLALSSFTYATPTVVTPYAATTWSDATGKTSRVITINFESGVQHLSVDGTVYDVAGTTQYVHTLEYLPGATGTLVIKAMNSATKLESASLSLSDVYTDYPQHAAPAEVGGSKTVTVSGSTYTYTATYTTTASTVEVQTYNTATSTYTSSDEAVVGGQVSVSRTYLIGQAGQPLFQLRAKTGEGKRSGTFVVAIAEAITFSKPVLEPGTVAQPNPVYTTLSAGSYRATFTYTVHPLATAVRVINPSTSGTYITTTAASGGSATFSVDYTEAQGATIAVITLANSSGLQSVASDPFTPLGQYDPPVQVAGSKTVTLSSGTYTQTAQYTSASPNGINVYGADGVTLVGSSTGASSPFTVTITYAADKFGQTVALLSSKETVNKRESEKTTSIVGEDLPNHATPVISGDITYGTSGANNTAQMNYSVTSNVDTLRVLKADQTELPAESTSVQQSIVSTTGATRVISVTVTFTDAVAPLNIVVVAEANTYGKQSAASDAQMLLVPYKAPVVKVNTDNTETVYATVSAGSYTATMSYTVEDLNVTQVAVRKSDNTAITSALVIEKTATFTVQFTDADSPLNIVVVALGNASGRESAASATQTLLKQFTAPTLTLNSLTYSGDTANITYDVATGVAQVQVRNASDNSVIKTISVSGTTATINLTVTANVNIVVVAVGNLSGRESAPSVQQALLKQFAVPTLNGSISYSGNTATMTYSVESGVTQVMAIKGTADTYSINPASDMGQTLGIPITLTDFPVLNAYPLWNMKITFRSTGKNSQWRALIGEMRNGIVTNDRGWGVWISDQNKIHFSWNGPTWNTTLMVAQNTDYELIFTKTTTSLKIDLKNVVANTTQTDTNASIASYVMSESGLVTLGGWINLSAENFVGTISHVNVVPALAPVTVSGGSAIVKVPVRNAESPLNVTVVALANSVGRESAASAQQTLLARFIAPKKATDPVYTTVSAGSYTASMTYDVGFGVNAVEVRKASDNTPISGATSSINSLIATITVPFTDANSPLNIVVVALVNPGVGRESLPSAQQTLLKRFTEPTLQLHTLTYSGNTANMTYSVAIGVDAVEVRNAISKAVIPSTTSVNTIMGTASVSVTITENTNIVVVALAKLGVGRESPESTQQTLLLQFTTPTKATGPVYAIVSDEFYTATMTYTVASGVDAIQVRSTHNGQEWMVWNQAQNSMIPASTYTISGNTATITVKVYTNNSANIFVVALAKSGVARESAGSATQALLPPFAKPVSVPSLRTVTKTTGFVELYNNSYTYPSISPGINLWDQPTGSKLSVTFTLNQYQPRQVIIGRYANITSYLGQFTHWALETGYDNTVRFIVNNNLSTTLNVITSVSAGISYTITITTDKTNNRLLFTTLNATTGQQIGTVTRTLTSAELAQFVTTNLFAGYISQYYDSYTNPLNGYISNVTITKYNEEFELSEYYLALSPHFWGAKLRVFNNDGTQIGSDITVATTTISNDNYSSDYFKAVVTYNASLIGQPVMKVKYIPVDGTRSESDFSDAVMGIGIFAAPTLELLTYSGNNASMVYNVANGVTSVEVRKVSDNSVITTKSVTGTIVTFDVTITANMSIVVVALSNQNGYKSENSIAQELTTQYDAPTKAREPEYTAVSPGNFTASMSYTVPTGVTGVAVRKAPAPYNTPVSGVTYDISGNTVTIIVPFTNADAPFNVVVFALATLSPSFRESEASVEQTLAKQLDVPTYSTMSQIGTNPYTASITYNVDNIANSVSVLKSSDASYSMYVANPTFRQPLVNFPLVGEMKVWTFTITQQLGTAALFIPSKGFLKIIFESNRVVITDTNTGYTEEITTGFHNLPRPTTFTLSQDDWSYLIQYDNNTKRKVFPNIHTQDAFVSESQNVNSTYTGPVMINNSRMILKIAFRCTGAIGINNRYALIGDRRNIPSMSMSANRGWSIDISDAYKLRFAWYFDSWNSELSVAQNTDYVLTVIHDRVASNIFQLTNVSTNTTVSATLNATSNNPVRLSPHGPVSVGGWLNDSSENFEGTISYVTAILGLGTANVSGSSAIVPVTFTAADTPLSVVAVAHSPTGMITFPSESFYLTPTVRLSPPVYVSNSITIINNVYKTTLTYTVESGVGSIQTNNANATTSLSGTTATVVFPTEDRSISVTAIHSTDPFKSSAPTVFTHTYTLPKIQIGGYDGFVGPTISFNKTFGSSGTGNTQFNKPIGIAHAHYIYGAGNSIQPLLFVSDTDNHRVQVYMSTLSNVTPPTYYATLGTGSAGTADHELNKPRQVAYCYKNKRIAIADSVNNRIVIWNVDYNQVVSFGFRTKFGSFGTGINNSQFNLPSGVAFDANGNIVVADTTNSRIKIFDSEGVHIRTWGTYGTTNGLLNYPQSVAVNSVGHIIVVCQNGAQIFKETGTFITIISAISTFSNSFPSVAVDNTGIGKIIVTNPTTNQIHVLSNAGSLITTFGSPGSGNGQFNHPSGVTVDHFGKIYVCDRLNNRIQVLNTNSLLLDADGPTIKYVGSAANVPTTTYLYIEENPRATGKELFAVAKQDMKYHIKYYPGSFNNIVTTLMTDMSEMFVDNTTFNAPISSWDTSSVTNMSQMFIFTDNFNQPIGTWNTSNVTDMSVMFYGARRFNQPIGAWNTANVTDMEDMFRFALAFNQPIGAWNTSAVRNMQAMFQYARAFNQPIGAWNTANVTDMGWMFDSASAFNQPIGNWNTSSVLRMIDMFKNATAFNQNLRGWNVGNIVGFEGFRLNSGLITDDFVPLFPGPTYLT